MKDYYNNLDHDAVYDIADGAPLKDIINDIYKIQKERRDARKDSYTNAIKEAIRLAIKDGYVIKFINWLSPSEDDACLLAIHTNNALLITVELEEE